MKKKITKKNKILDNSFIFILWCGKTRVASYELQVEILKERVEIQKCEFKSTSWNSPGASSTFELQV